MLYNYLKILFVIIFYWFVSISLIFVNKWLLSENDAELDLPFFITWFQVLVNFILCSFVSCFGEILGERNPLKHPFSLSDAIKLYPLSIIFCCMTSFNNLSLQSLGISFYYVARSLSTIFNALLSYLILKLETSRYSLISCIFLMIGYALGSTAEAATGKMSWYGLFYGLAASLFVALYAIYIKKYLAHLKNNIWTLQWYTSFNALFIFIIPMYLNKELGTLYGSIPLNEITFWFYMLVGAFFGVLIGFATALQIKHTSPLTHNVSGTAKAAFQTILSVMVYHESKSFTWCIGNLVVLIASSMYTWVRHKEMQGQRNKRTDSEEYSRKSVSQ